MIEPWPCTYPQELAGLSIDLSDSSSLRTTATLSGWHIVDQHRHIGHGREFFESAARGLLTWQVHALAGISVLSSGSTEEATVGDVVTLSIAGTQSPCYVFDIKRTGRLVRLTYGTMAGHVECGEETFELQLHDDASVTGGCRAFSKHAWWLARLGAPVARAAQRHFTNKYIVGMRECGGRIL
ncbi:MULTISPECIES: DUF1990 domain-containing protein [unclassified Corynebacterium]|uniref:DUF1990 domain-containing protein n=1 Tax=unclassified Corynebacterium TaxID=2624378 RepID=UPI0030B3E72D